MRNIMREQMLLLDELYAKLNSALFNSELPDVAITIQSKGRKKAYAWFTLDKIWQDKNSKDKEEITYHEINLSAEFMDRGLNAIAESLIHEMVHFANKMADIKDCNPKTQNHNKHFKELAEKVGLVVEKTPKHGWAETSLSSELEKLIESFNLKDLFTIARVNRSIEKEKKEKKRPYKYICECGIDIKTTKDLEIICAKCNSAFEKIED